MVQLTRIYTKGGDKGRTSLGGGTRVAKYDPRIMAIGTVDEANTAIGLARLHVDGDLDHVLKIVQNDLFDMGADLCTLENPEKTGPALRITAEQVVFLEQTIDRLNSDLAPLHSFVLPGGTHASAHLHQARVTTRRAERDICFLHEQEPLNPSMIHYINRLSDLLFVMARFANNKGKEDVLWVPGGQQRHQQG